MQNSVLTKLKQAGFSAELIDFLLQFYIGAVNVYGIISLDDLYDLFQKIKEHNAAYPEITSEQFISRYMRMRLHFRHCHSRTTEYHYPLQGQ